MTRLISTLVLSAVGLLTAYGLLGRQLGVSAPELWQALAEVRTLEPERSPVLPSDPPARPPENGNASSALPAVSSPAPPKPVRPKPEAPAPKPAPPAVADAEPRPAVVIEPARAFVEESPQVAGDTWIDAGDGEEARAAAAGDAQAPDQDAWAALIRRMLAIYQRTGKPE